MLHASVTTNENTDTKTNTDNGKYRDKYKDKELILCVCAGESSGIKGGALMLQPWVKTSLA